MISPAMLKKLQTLGGTLGVAVVLNGRDLHFYGATGSHWLDAGNGDDDRALAHFQGFAEAQPTWERSSMPSPVRSAAARKAARASSAPTRSVRTTSTAP